MPDKLSYTVHNREYFGENMLVYPVKSRRTGGLSIGINTSPSQVCNFNCVYCEVDRTKRNKSHLKFKIESVEEQLLSLISSIVLGEIWGGEDVKDIALSGDGEPTQLKEFDKVIDLVVRIRKKFHLHDTKIITITNATGLHRETVRKGIGKMQLKDEIWAKLDAGSSEYFKIISGSRTAFSRVLNNVLTLSREKAVKIQTCFMNINGKPPSNADLLDYCSAVNNIVSAGGSIDQIQLYTPTRPAMNSLVTPLSEYQLDKIKSVIELNVNPLDVKMYY